MLRLCLLFIHSCFHSLYFVFIVHRPVPCYIPGYSGGAGEGGGGVGVSIAVRGQIYMGAPIGVVEIY